MRVHLFCLFLMLSVVNVFAQKGNLRGVIFEEESGELLPGVTVFVEGTSIGTITDLDGKFNLGLAAGTYDLRISFISYDPILLKGIEVKAGQVNVLDDMGLKKATVEMNEVTVTAQAIRNTETALMAIKRKSPNLMDGISATGLRRIGDSDAAAAMKRVTGVSVSGGKYVYVRGLGDRYTKTTLNGVDIPGLDPDRNTLQMDIFPTSILDNLIVNKSFSANLPADFTGGLIDITTKDFPETKIGSASIGLGYNPGFHFNSNFVTYEGGKTDWLGFDDGTRQNNIRVSNLNILTPAGTQFDGTQHRSALESFNPVMAAHTERNLMDIEASVATGNQYEKENVTLGYNFALSYKTETAFYEEALNTKYILNLDRNITKLDLADYQNGNIGIQNTFIGGLAGFAIKTLNSKFRFNIVHLQNGETKAGIFDRMKNNRGSGFDNGLQHNLNYTQRSLTNVLIDGKHLFSENDWTIEWKLSPTLSMLRDPDIRMTQYTIEEDGGFDIDGGENDKPARIWRELTEIDVTGLFHITKGYNVFNTEAKLKFGGLYTLKNRDFLIETYKFNISGVEFTGNPNELFYEKNLWPYNGIDPSSGDGVQVEQNFYPTNPNEYNGIVHNIAGYLETELSPLPKLKTTLGVRMEKYQQYYTGESTSIMLEDELMLDELNFFPEINLVYALLPKMNVRVSFSQTIARPSFKELSYAQIEDPISGTTFNGGLYSATSEGEVIWDGNLVSTHINNYDLRWEQYFEGGEMVSVSGFYKTFEDPIEIIIYSGTSTVNLQPRNVGNGTVMGAETEFRLNLGTLFAPLTPLSVSSNITLISSEIDRNKEEYEQKNDWARTGETIEKSRVMAGMSPYIINGGLSYLGRTGITQGLEAGLYYNVQGESLEIIGTDDRPDVYTKPFHSLNFNSSKTFGSRNQYQLGFKVKNILGASKEMVSKSYKSDDLLYEMRKPGTSFNVKLKYNFN